MPRRIHLQSLLIGSAMCLLAQCGKREIAGADGDAGVLARVGDERITEEDLREEASWLRENRRPVPDAEALLQEMIRHRALVQRSRQEGLDADPEIRRRIDSVLIAALRLREIDARLEQIEVTEEEVRAAYEAEPAAHQREGIDRFAILFLEAASGSSEERRSQARRRLEEGLALAEARPAEGGRGPAASGFGQVAIEYSDDHASRHRGGDVGWIKTSAERTRLPMSVLTAGRALAKGEHSGVIETEEGFYAIMKTDLRAGGTISFEEVAGELHAKLLRERRLEAEESFVASALDEAGVEINQDALRDIELPASITAESKPLTPPGIPDPSSGVR